MDRKDSLDNKISVDMDFQDLLGSEDNEKFISDMLRDSASVGVATQAGVQMNALQRAMDNYAEAMNASAISKTTGLPVKTNAAQYKGFAAEEYFKHTTKINALAKGVPEYKLGVYTNGIMPDGSELSRIDMEVDISLWTRKHFWSKPMRTADYQSKIHNNPVDYVKDMNKPQYQNVDFVGGSGQGVNDKVRIQVGNKEIASDSITPKEAEELAEKMKAQATPEYAKRAEKIKELNARSFESAVKAGALVGFTVSTVQEIINVIMNRNNLSEDQFVESITNILCGTAEGAVRGGAINLSVQLMGQMLGKEITSASLEAVPAMAIANFSVDLAKDLYKCFVKGTIDTDDLLCNSVDNLFTSVAGFGGGWIGGQAVGLLVSAKASAATGAAIGSSIGPIGTIIGAVVGGVVFGIGARIISNTAGKDAYKAFEACMNDVNSHIELSGIERIYYFADSMSSLSDHKISFKDLLPCYNLISDLKEYNLHRKAIKNISNQLAANLSELDAKKRDALVKLETAHKEKLYMLESMFNDQRESLRDEFRETLNTYVVNSYAQYVGVIAVQSEQLDQLLEKYESDKQLHSSILDYMQYRNKANENINSEIEELLSEPESKKLLEPFIERLVWFMQQDELLVGRQYISYNEALHYVNHGVEA